MKYTGLFIILALFFLSSHSAFADYCKVENLKISYIDYLGKYSVEKYDTVRKLDNAKVSDCERLAFEEEFNRCYDFANKQIALLSNVTVTSFSNNGTVGIESNYTCDYVLNVRRFEDRFPNRTVASD